MQERSIGRRTIPARLTAFRDEVSRARSVLTTGLQATGKSQLTAFATIVAEAEAEIMTEVEMRLASKGYTAGTLVHDALIVQRDDGEACDTADRERIGETVHEALRAMSSSRRWSVVPQMSVNRAGE